MKRAPIGVFPVEHSWIAKDKLMAKAIGEYRNPCKGEYYLSGAIVTAYLAPNDLGSPYWIAKPVKLEQCRCCKGTGKVEVL